MLIWAKITFSEDNVWFVNCIHVTRLISYTQIVFNVSTLSLIRWLVSNYICVIEVSYLITTVVIISTCWYQYSANFLRNCSSMHIENTCLYQEKETLGVDDNNCAVLSIYCLHTPYNSFLFCYNAYIVCREIWACIKSTSTYKGRVKCGEVAELNICTNSVFNFQIIQHKDSRLCFTRFHTSKAEVM